MYTPPWPHPPSDRWVATNSHAAAATSFSAAPASLRPNSRNTRSSVSAGFAFNNQPRAWVAAVGCYANCDGSTVAPVLNVQDFGCFLQKYAGGCP